MKKVSSTSERLKYYMDHTGLTQTDILDRCAPYETEQVKISRPYLSQYVTGKFEPNQERLEVLARAMNVDEVWLMGYDVPMRADTDEFRQEMFDEDHVLFDYTRLSDESKKTVRSIINALKAQENNSNP